MVRFPLVPGFAAVVALGVEWIFLGVPASPAAAATVRAERWRLLLGLALLVSGGLFAFFAAMSGVFARARLQAVALRRSALPARR